MGKSWVAQVHITAVCGLKMEFAGREENLTMGNRVLCRITGLQQHAEEILRLLTSHCPANTEPRPLILSREGRCSRPGGKWMNNKSLIVNTVS